jgi:transcriptional regulator with XRE-family HTH domain
MNERLKKLRKALDLTQQEFAERIGSKRNTIAKYETNTNIPSSAVISLICREFNVSEEWLRDGTGEMFIEQTRDEEIASFVGSIQANADDSFKKRFISILSKLDESEWEVLEKMVLMMTDKKD